MCPSLSTTTCGKAARLAVGLMKPPSLVTLMRSPAAVALALGLGLGLALGADVGGGLALGAGVGLGDGVGVGVGDAAVHAATSSASTPTTGIRISDTGNSHQLHDRPRRPRLPL